MPEQFLMPKLLGIFNREPDFFPMEQVFPAFSYPPGKTYICLGNNNQTFNFCFILPAIEPASLPHPQKKSARTGPAIAPPVSWAITNLLNGFFEFGIVVSKKTGVPIGIYFRSTAIERPGVNGTPCEPF